MDEDKLKREVQKPGLVMLDDLYGFKVCEECYIFGKINKDGNIIKPLYPTTINGVLTLYGKVKVSDLAADKQLTISQFKDIVSEVKDMIKDISNKLEV